jgi:hypothetical protein
LRRFHRSQDFVPPEDMEAPIRVDSADHAMVFHPIGLMN